MNNYISVVVIRYFIALFSVYFLALNCFAQDKVLVDSLNQAYKTAKHDTDKINCLFELYEILVGPDPDTCIIINKIAYTTAKNNLTDDLPPSLEKRYLFLLAEALNHIGFTSDRQGDITKALEYYHKSLKIYEQGGFKNGIAYSFNNIGGIYDGQGDIHKALDYYNKCFKIVQETGDKEGIAMSLNNIGFIYHNQGDIPQALEYYLRSLKIYEEIGNKEGTASTLNNIAVIYVSQGDLTKGLEYHQKCLKIVEEISYKNGIASCLNNIGRIHDEQGDVDQALDCYQKSLKIQEEVGNKSGIAYSLHNIGSVYESQGDFSEALEYYHRSLKIKEEIGDKSGIANSLSNIGHLELDQSSAATSTNDSAVDQIRIDNQRSLERALKYGKRGLEIAREIGSPNLISANSRLLSKVAKKQGNYEDALEMYELHIQMRDSVKNEENQKATIRQQTKYEFEKAQLVKEQEEREVAREAAEIVSRRDNLQYSIVLIGLLVIGVLVAMLGRMSLPERVAEGLIFFAFLIFFEFILVLADPYVEKWTGGAPGLKLLINAGVAALIFPLHAFFESRLKGRLVKNSSA